MQVQEAQRVVNKLDPKRATARHIKIKMPEVKCKERILKTSREKLLYRGVAIRLISQKKLCRLEGTGKKYSK